MKIRDLFENVVVADDLAIPDHQPRDFDQLKLKLEKIELVCYVQTINPGLGVIEAWRKLKKIYRSMWPTKHIKIWITGKCCEKSKSELQQ
jgi:hypothetical protein